VAVSNPTADWVNRAESLILSLRDVRGVDIAADGDELLEINILASGDRSPKQIARDVRSALRAELKLDVDHRKISVAQRRDDIGDPEGAVLDLVPSLDEAAADRRLRFLGLNLNLAPNRATAQVELGLGDQEALGQAEGPGSQEETARLIARATLDAVATFVPEDSAFSLADIRLIDMAGETIVLVHLNFQRGRQLQPLSGSCVAGRDLQTSVVFATLAALNRVLGRLSLREPVEYELRPTSI
jgi:hypothetical protein